MAMLYAYVTNSHKERTHEISIGGKDSKLITAGEEDPKLTQKELRKSFGIGRSTVNNIPRKQSQYWEAWESIAAQMTVHQQGSSYTLRALNKLIDVTEMRRSQRSKQLFCCKLPL